MAKTRENNFLKLVSYFTSSINNRNYAKPTIEKIVKHQIYDECLNVYHLLGGVLEEIPIRIGGFDFIIDNKIVELDEEAHFNRYRKLTLSSNIYKSNPYVKIQNYVSYCDLYEKDCLKGRSFGGYWTNSSTEKQFGKSAPNGILTENGSARWKQRAFYDFIKDIIHIIYEIPVIRLSIYDKFSLANGEKILLNQILSSSDRKNFTPVYDFIYNFKYEV